MLKHFYFVYLFIFSVGVHAQVKKVPGNTIGISIPVIWNNSNGIYYSTGNRKEPTGNAISYGLNANFSRSFYKNWFFTIGAGYFKQTFKISRPFYYYYQADPIQRPLYYTKNYIYHNLHLQAGVGYKFKFSNRFSMNCLATYHLLPSLRQKYTALVWKPSQTTTKNMNIGHSVNVSIGGEKMITNKIGVGADILTPLLMKWNEDSMFLESDWGKDAKIIAENKFSIGVVISCKYHF